MQFLFSPVQGALSDRFGRRPVILASNFGLGLDYILMALAPSLMLLFVGRVISGMTAASFSVANAYVADVTPPEQRAGRYGLIGAAFGAGFIIGPALGRARSAASIRGCRSGSPPRFSLVNGLYGIFVLPELLPRSKRAAFSWRPRQSARFAQPAALASRVVRACVREFPQQPRPCGAAECDRALHDVPLWLGRVHDRSQHDVHRRVRAGRAGWLDRPVRRALRRPCGADHRACLWRCRVCELRARMDRGLFWIGIPILSLWGLGGAAIQALMTKRVSAHEAGPVAGRQREPDGDRQHDRPGHLRRELCARHRELVRALAVRRAVPAGGSVSGARAGDRLAGNAAAVAPVLLGLAEFHELAGREIIILPGLGHARQAKLDDLVRDFVGLVDIRHVEPRASPSPACGCGSDRAP